MIASPSIAFNGFSGSAGGVTARYVDGRTILGLKAYASGGSTNAQVARRASFTTITRSWKLLTDAEREAWNRMAETATGRSVLGQKAKISGFNLYVRLNANRQLAGEALMTTPPATMGALPNVRFGKLWMTPQVVVIKGITHEPAPCKLVVKMSTGQSRGVSNGWRKTVIISPGMEDDWGDADVTQLYLKTLGVTPKPGQKVFLEMYWLDTTSGCTGFTAKSSTEVLTQEEAEAAGMPVRLRYSMGNVTPATASEVSALDVEFSTASPVVFMDSVFSGTGSTASAEVALDSAIPAAQTGNAFVVGRGCSDDGNLKPQSYLVYVSNRDGKGNLTYARRGGTMTRPSEVFGPAMLVNSN